MRISARVRDASASITASARTAAEGSVAATARPACAWIAMADTWWATVSCSSRASSPRSCVRTCWTSRWWATARQRIAAPRANDATTTVVPPTTSPRLPLDARPETTGTAMIAVPTSASRPDAQR